MMDSIEQGIQVQDSPALRPSKSALLCRDFSAFGSRGLEVALPVGIATREGPVIRQVRLEPLTGRDEQWLSQVVDDGNLPRWVTLLLDEKVCWPGKPLGEKGARQLPLVDRDMLILRLRMLTFGPEIWAVAQCPHGDCGMKLDCTFDLASLKVPRCHEPENDRAGTVEDRGTVVAFSFREPNGADQEAMVEAEHPSAAEAGLDLMARCLVQWGGATEISKEMLEGLSPEALLELDRVIADNVTSFDWDIRLTCAECGRPFVSSLNIQPFFWEELQYTAGDLWEDVHEIALHYHWSEAEILSLSRWKRKMYLNHIHRAFSNRG